MEYFVNNAIFIVVIWIADAKDSHNAKDLSGMRLLKIG
jgi:hypothetical protein